MRSRSFRYQAVRLVVGWLVASTTTPVLAQEAGAEVEAAVAPPPAGQPAGDFNIWAEYYATRFDYREAALYKRLAQLPPTSGVARAEIERELQTLRFERNELSNKRLNIGLNAMVLAPVKVGELSSSVYRAFDYFFSEIIPAEVIRDAMSQEVGELLRDNFIPSKPERAPAALHSFPGGNIGELFEFLRANRLSARRWSRAHFHLLDLCTHLTAPAVRAIEQMRRAMGKIHSES